MNPIVLGMSGMMVVLLTLATWKAPRLSSILFWALVATIFTSAAILVSAPGEFKDKALWMTLAVPVIWTLFQFLVYWTGKPWRVVAGFIVISVLGGVIVFLSEPMA